MVEVIMVSHGDYAKSMLESAQMIVGEQDHVQTFGLYLGDSVDKLREDLVEAIEKVEKTVSFWFLRICFPAARLTLRIH